MAKIRLINNPKTRRLILGLLMLILFGGFNLAQGASRDIFKKPDLPAATAKKLPISTTAQLNEEARLKELMDILNQEATVTYPNILEIGQIKQAESQNIPVLSQPQTSFNKAMPYLLGLIVLLILVIIIFLWHWLRQKSKLFFDQHQETIINKSLAAVLPVKPIEAFEHKPKLVNQELVKKNVKPPVSINQIKPKNNQPGVLNLKDLSQQVKIKAKRNRFI